jgi:hypothetical protein
MPYRSENRPSHDCQLLRQRRPRLARYAPSTSENRPWKLRELARQISDLRHHRLDFTAVAADDYMSSIGGVIAIFSSYLPTPLPNKRMTIMNDATIGLDQIEELPAYEVSDEGLEAAAGSEKAGYTLAYCSGLSVCPA